MEEMSLLEAPRLWMQSVILVSCISCHILRAFGPVAMPIQSNPFNYGVYNCNLVSAGFQVSAIKQCQCQSRINPKNPTVLAFNKKAYPTASHLTCYGLATFQFKDLVSTRLWGNTSGRKVMNQLMASNSWCSVMEKNQLLQAWPWKMGQMRGLS